MEKYLKAAKPVVDFINDNDGFVVVCHHDADGLTAGAIMSLCLERLGKKSVPFSTKQLDSRKVAAAKELGKHFIFVDLGSGQIPMIEENMGSFAICDHHATLHETKAPHFNAHLFGLDGSREVSGAGMAYLAAKAVDSANINLAHLAIVGAVGDMQDSRGGLTGFNRKILADAEKSGMMESRQDIRLFGRHSRPLLQFLAFNSEPVFPGLTANEEGCAKFLGELGINFHGKYYVDLTPDEQKKLVSALFVRGLQGGIPEFILKGLVGEVYELTNEENKSLVKDSKDFATMLNACGRHEEGEIGIRVCMGDRDEYYNKASAMLQKHRRLLRQGLEYAQQKGVEEREGIYILDAGDAIQDTLIGVIAGMLYGAQVIGQEKPIVGLCVEDKDTLKISARANWNLVRKGLDLGKALRDVAGPLGGEGGGHNIAAGARVPKEKEEQFLEEFDRAVRRQLKGGKP